LDPEFPGHFTPENLTFDAVGACYVSYKVAECRTEKNGNDLLSVNDPCASLFSYPKEVCTIRMPMRGAWNGLSTIIILLDPEFPGASHPEISHLMQ
jgi:hypothetical protein